MFWLLDSCAGVRANRTVIVRVRAKLSSVGSVAMNANIRDGPAGGAVGEVPQPPPETLSVEVRPEVPEGPIRPGDDFPTASGPAAA